MEDGDKADVCPQVLGISGQFFECLRRRFEEDVVDDLLVVQGQGSELLWEGEDDVEVMDGQQVLFPSVDPSSCG